MCFGLLNINKPGDLTSRKAVDHVVRLVKPAKAGHAGTLDPLATGVLIVCVGRATRLIPHIQSQRKVYRGRFLLGQRSNTDDVTGEVQIVSDAARVTEQQIADLLPRFVGRIEQVPPQFSAVHVNGQRAYKLARQGETVVIPPKTVEVFRITLTEFSDPELELEIECGSGTYIRSIGRDLGDLLGCGAVMSELVRTRIGPFCIHDAVKLENLDQQTLSGCLLPAVRAVDQLGKHVCSDQQLEAIRHGRRIPWDQSAAEGESIALVTATGDLAALARYHAEDRTLAPKQVFLMTNDR